MALIDTHKAVKQFTTAGIPEKQAEAITEVISNIDQHVATKSDIARLEDKIEIESKWIKALLLLLLAVGIKIAFFNS